MSKIVVENAVKRKTGWLYYIDVEGNLCGYDMVARKKKLDSRIVKKKRVSRKRDFTLLEHKPSSSQFTRKVSK